MDVAKPFLFEVPERAVELKALVAHHVIAEIAVRAAGVTLAAHLLRHIEHQRNRKAVVLARERDERLPCLGLDIGRIDHCQAAGLQALPGDELQHLESRSGRRLVVLVVRDQPAAVVRRQDLGRQEMPAGKRRLS
jgi:hypothetical protein